MPPKARLPSRPRMAGWCCDLKPDLAGGEIVADGFRNAYDFDFDPQGNSVVRQRRRARYLASLVPPDPGAARFARR